jgi:hypothetical protein
MLFITLSSAVITPIATGFLIAAGVYLLVGLLFYFPFIRKGIHLVDENAHGSSIGFYLIILPGTLAFWPVLLAKWRKALKQHSHDRLT